MTLSSRLLLDSEAIEAADNVVASINAESSGYKVRWWASNEVVSYPVTKTVINFAFTGRLDPSLPYWFWCVRVFPEIVVDAGFDTKGYLLREFSLWFKSKIRHEKKEETVKKLIGKLYYERLEEEEVRGLENAVRDFMSQRMISCPVRESDICLPWLEWHSDEKHGDALTLQLKFGNPAGSEIKTVQFPIIDPKQISGAWIFQKWLQAKIHMGEIKVAE